MAFASKWNPIINKCPNTYKWLTKTYPSNQYGRVRFMLLKPNGKINPHKDTEYPILGAINVALNNPTGCKWMWDNEELEMQPGCAYAMNLSYIHSVINNSNQPRIHMIIHHYDSIDKWKHMMKKSADKANVKYSFCFSTKLF